MKKDAKKIKEEEKEKKEKKLKIEKQKSIKLKIEKQKSIVKDEGTKKVKSVTRSINFSYRIKKVKRKSIDGSKSFYFYVPHRQKPKRKPKQLDID